MAQLLVFVRHAEDTFPIEVPADGSVGDLRRAAQEAAGVRGRLLLGGRPLDDGELLADSGLSSECVVILEDPDVVYVVWANCEPGRDAREEIAKVRQLYCDASPEAVPPSQSEAGAKVFREYADDWSRRTGLSAVGPLDKDISLMELLRDCVYSEGTKERAAMMQQLTEASKGPESDDEPCDTVVPHNHFFVALGVGPPPVGKVYSLDASCAKVMHGVHMYEVTLKRAHARAFRFGWQIEDSCRARNRTLWPLPEQATVGDQHGRFGQGGGWALCTLGGLRAGDGTQAQCFSELVGSEPVPVDTGDGQCTWGEGDTVATAIDCDRGQILFALPGKGWFVGFADVSLSAPVIPAFAAVECLVDLNLGERPFKHPPPRGAAPVLRSAGSKRPRLFDPVRHESVAVYAGHTMPSRGLMTDAEYEEWRRLRRERRQAAWSPPPHPFADGWMARSSWRVRSEMQWGRPLRVPPCTYYDDKAPALDVLLAASTSERRPHGSDVLRYVRTLNRVAADGCTEARVQNEWYWRRRVEGVPPLLPLAAYNVRRRSTSHRATGRLRRPAHRLMFVTTNGSLWDQGVRPGDLIVLETRPATRLAVCGEPPAELLQR
eukprot:TRINITY_DN1695_c0_g1_i16.p1 TRINITY_DN1695_c0_g1~~TRINITY_DN1695_c0_g1_i16.p1  ORF type:complete len:604 (+),score=158.96 TRINITY_DN1695_c0_g1_i16:57-1868(+)